MLLFEAHLAALLVSAVLTVGVAGWVYRRGRGRPAELFVVLLSLDTLWALGAALQLVLADTSLAWPVYATVTVISLAVPVVWFSFALTYGGWTHLLSPPVKVGLGGVYLGGVVVALADLRGGLTITQPQLVTTPFAHLVGTESGSLVALLIAVQLVLVFGGLAVLLRTALISRRALSQIGLLVLAGGVATGVNVASMAGHLPVETFDYTPIGAGLFAVTSGWALFRHQLFDITPMARTQLFANLEEPVIVVDADRRVVDFNAAATSAFDGLESAVSRPLGSVVPGLIDGDATGSDQFADSWTRREGGELQTMAVSTTPLTAGGDIRGHALVVRDVTDVESYARQLERQTDQLERFASTVSHDLKNPLSVANGYLDIAQETGDQTDLDRVDRALDRMEGIIDDVLTLAREGQPIDAPEFCRLAEAAHTAWETSPTGTATLSISVPADCTVYADPERLRTVFENLFRNAVAHGRPDVDIRVGLLENEAGFYVEDDGPGIQAPNREQVFEYGYTLADDGTGLGLAIVSSVAAAHGWQVHVTEGDDGGARFVFEDATLLDTAVADANAHTIVGEN